MKKLLSNDVREKDQAKHNMRPDFRKRKWKCRFNVYAWCYYVTEPALLKFKIILKLKKGLKSVN